MLLFDLEPSHALGANIASLLDTELSRHEWRRFEDGEFKLRPLVDPRGSDVYVMCGLHGGPQDSPQDKLVALAMFIAALRDHGARRVTAVVPYLAYARKDRRTKPFDPVGSRYVAQMLESVALSQLLVLEAHNPAALENAFRCPTLHIAAHTVFDTLVDRLPARRLVVASPDPGGVKRAQLWREHLAADGKRDVGFALIDKRRSAGVVSGVDEVVGDVSDAHVLLLDDLIATGHTLLRAAYALRAAGARHVTACAAHGLFVEAAAHSLGDPVIDDVVVTDSLPAFRVGEGTPLQGRLSIVSCASLFADAIRDCHAGWEA